MTLIETLEQSAGKWSAKTAVTYKETRVSYGELLERSRALAAFLADAGLKKGERVGILLDKTPEAIVAFLGSAAAGGIVFPMDNNLLPADLQFVLDLTKPAALIVASKYQPLLSGLRVPCQETRVVIVGEKARHQHISWSEITAGSWRSFPDVKLEDDDVVYLNFTSGSTGTPKAAVTTHENIYWNTLGSIEAMRLTHDDVHICMFPAFAHPHELFARPLLLGGTMALVEGISPKAIARTIRENGVTAMMAVASIYASLAKLDPAHVPNLEPLRVAESGGMHVVPALAQRFLERFRIPIIPVWGSTETTGIALAKPWDEPYKPGAIGRACPYYEADIVDEDGNPAGVNEIGQLTVRGRGVCSGYYRNPEETVAQMRDGWVRTGDLFKKDEDGYFYFMGRTGGVMKVAGLKVSPVEIEDVISSHPAVAEVAVVRVYDPSHGEVPKAVVALKDGLKMETRELIKFCEKRLARYKMPRIVELTKELPKSSGGKILYRKLQEQMR